jgi:hypothetical protein
MSYSLHRSLFAHRGHVTCIHIDAFQVISGSRDKRVIMNDFLENAMSKDIIPKKKREFLWIKHRLYY